MVYTFDINRRNKLGDALNCVSTYLFIDEKSFVPLNYVWAKNLSPHQL